MARSTMRSKTQTRKSSKAQRRQKANPWMVATIVLVIVISVMGVIIVQGLYRKGTSQQAITSLEQVQRIKPAKAKALLDRGEAELYDTRSFEAYREKHATGAISFPEARQETFVATLPYDKALVFY